MDPSALKGVWHGLSVRETVMRRCRSNRGGRDLRSRGGLGRGRIVPRAAPWPDGAGAAGYLAGNGLLWIAAQLDELPESLWNERLAEVRRYVRLPLAIASPRMCRGACYSVCPHEAGLRPG